MNNQYILLPLLFFVWFLLWGIYNLILLKRGICTEKKPSFVSLFFVLFTFLLLYIFREYIPEDFNIYVYIFCCLLVLFAFVTNTITTGRLSNSIFQMIWLYLLFVLIGENILYTSLLFLLGHLPIVFLDHLGVLGKTILLVVTCFGGFVFSLSLSFFPYPFNILTTVLIHFLFYMFLRPIDRRYNWGIVN
jgi:hypothetical protein